MVMVRYWNAKWSELTATTTAGRKTRAFVVAWDGNQPEAAQLKRQGLYVTCKACQRKSDQCLWQRRRRHPQSVLISDFGSCLQNDLWWCRLQTRSRFKSASHATDSMSSELKEFYNDYICEARPIERYGF